jgi:hypothetical protein
MGLRPAKADENHIFDSAMFRSDRSDALLAPARGTQLIQVDGPSSAYPTILVFNGGTDD